MLGFDLRVRRPHQSPTGKNDEALRRWGKNPVSERNPVGRFDFRRKGLGFRGFPNETCEFPTIYAIIFFGEFMMKQVFTVTIEDVLEPAEGQSPHTKTVETWERDGVKHRDRAPAEVQRDDDERIVGEKWIMEGRLHRESGPAVSIQEGGTITEEWLQNGHRSRTDGPAETTRDLHTGILIRENWYVDGKAHREDGPAVINRCPDSGIVVKELWLKNDVFSRKDGPSSILRDPQTGVAVEECWIEGMKLHRKGGPDRITRDANTGEAQGEGHAETPSDLPLSDTSSVRLDFDGA